MVTELHLTSPLFAPPPPPSQLAYDTPTYTTTEQARHVFPILSHIPIDDVQILVKLNKLTKKSSLLSNSIEWVEKIMESLQSLKTRLGLTSVSLCNLIEMWAENEDSLSTN